MKKNWQVEFVANDDLLDEYGNLKHVGFGRHQFLTYNKRNLNASKWRLKEWDYYLVYNKKGAVALTVDDNGYMGMLSASVIDFNTPSETTKSKIKWFTFGKMNLPTSSAKGDVEYVDKNIKASFKIEGNSRHLYYYWKNFKDKQNLEVDITLTREPKESMNIATPFDKPKHFYYNQKIIGFSASGSVKLGDDEVLTFDPENAFGLLDWGRGVWTYKNTWIWGACMADIDGNTFGLNIGYGFGNTKNATENMIFYNGIAHKLEEVKVDFEEQNGKINYLLPVKVTSSDNRLNVDFIPIIDRHANTDVLIIGSNQHQVFGLFNGTATLDDGSVIELKNVYGFIERVVNRW